MKIRLFIDSDVSAVQQLLEQLTGHKEEESVITARFEFFKTSPTEFLFIAEMDAEVVGLLSFRIRENVEDATRYGEVSLLVTDQKHRRKGIAGQLMNFAEKLAKEKGCIGLWLVSGFGREEQAHDFYKNYGFQVTGYRFVKRFDQQ